jgi:hypothetical protein
LPKKIGEKNGFLTQNKAILFKNLIITLVFDKNANFFAENCQKSLKIVIITSVLGLTREGINKYFDLLFLRSQLNLGSSMLSTSEIAQ